MRHRWACFSYRSVSEVNISLATPFAKFATECNPHRYPHPPAHPHPHPSPWLQSFELSQDQLRALALGAADHSFLPEAERAALRQRMEAVLSAQSRLAQPHLTTPGLVAHQLAAQN